MNPPETLGLERREMGNRTSIVGDEEHGTIMLAPMVNEGYWSYRVRLTDTQAIVGFPKFITIGIGFAVEDASWNTNLPYTQDAERIADHIWHNHGDSIPDTPEWKQTVTAAIAIIQNAIHEDGGPQ
jgi:hypothetical protein